MSRGWRVIPVGPWIWGCALARKGHCLNFLFYSFYYYIRISGCWNGSTLIGSPIIEDSSFDTREWIFRMTRKYTYLRFYAKKFIFLIFGLLHLDLPDIEYKVYCQFNIWHVLRKPGKRFRYWSNHPNTYFIFAKWIRSSLTRDLNRISSIRLVYICTVNFLRKYG